MISVFEKIRKYIKGNSNSINAISKGASVPAVHANYSTATGEAMPPYYGRVRDRRRKARKSARKARRVNR